MKTQLDFNVLDYLEKIHHSSKNAQLLAWVKQNMGYREPEPAELAQAQAANPPQEQQP